MWCITLSLLLYRLSHYSLFIAQGCQWITLTNDCKWVLRVEIFLLLGRRRACKYSLRDDKVFTNPRLYAFDVKLTKSKYWPLCAVLLWMERFTVLFDLLMSLIKTVMSRNKMVQNIDQIYRAFINNHSASFLSWIQSNLPVIGLMCSQLVHRRFVCVQLLRNQIGYYKQIIQNILANCQHEYEMKCLMKGYNCFVKRHIRKMRIHMDDEHLAGSRGSML